LTNQNAGAIIQKNKGDFQLKKARFFRAFFVPKGRDKIAKKQRKAIKIAASAHCIG
jgi:hypothetical protein